MNAYYLRRCKIFQRTLTRVSLCLKKKRKNIEEKDAREIEKEIEIACHTYILRTFFNKTLHRS